MPIETLKRRSQFLQLRGGLRHPTPAFVLEAKPRAAGNGAAEGPRFGFTVTKRIGKAVVRNRVRRRLKAAVGELAKGSADPGFDYVLIARAAALDRSFALLKRDLINAFAGIGAQARRKPAS